LSGSRPFGSQGGPALRLRRPLLDRLLDAEPGGQEPPDPTPAQAFDALRAAVRRDLEALLNARRRRRPLPPRLKELAMSPLNYGVPDPTSGSFAITARRQALAQEVETTIRRYEPRLTGVRVTLLDDDELGRMLRVKVDAVLRADPITEQVSFETLFEPVSRDVTVREG
jgi:type VI secretion system protein ImpF